MFFVCVTMERWESPFHPRLLNCALDQGTYGGLVPGRRPLFTTHAIRSFHAIRSGFRQPLMPLIAKVVALCLFPLATT